MLKRQVLVPELYSKSSGTFASIIPRRTLAPIVELRLNYVKIIQFQSLARVVA